MNNCSIFLYVFMLRPSGGGSECQFSDFMLTPLVALISTDSLIIKKNCKTCPNTMLNPFSPPLVTLTMYNNMKLFHSTSADKNTIDRFTFLAS